jgi:hypothetical protein
VLEDLERLRTESSLGEEQQLEVWRNIKSRAPGLFGGTALKILQSLASAYVLQKLGL